MQRKYREAELARAVARAFASAGFGPQDLLTGEIKYTSLPWQCPPLRSEVPLEGVPFYDHLDCGWKVDPKKVFEFWRHGLDELAQNPIKLIGPNGWRMAAQFVPGARQGDRQLLFSIPDEFPGVTPYSGAIFSMEVAHLLAQSVKVDDFVSDDNNYFVVVKGLGYIGVMDGKPVGSEDMWGDSLEGVVQTYLMSGRGQVTKTCRYDLLAKVRSVLHENPERFPEFEGVDWALQSLGILSAGKLCRSLQQAIEGMKANILRAKLKLARVEEAIAQMKTFTVNDRLKIVALQEILVPEVLSATQFQAKIFNVYHTIPVIMAATTERKILNYLNALVVRLNKEIG
jgi:hypothetical protein